jgi:hypothetical protein
MRSIPREDVPVVIGDNGVEVRLRDEDGLSVGFVRLPAAVICSESVTSSISGSKRSDPVDARDECRFHPDGV